MSLFDFIQRHKCTVRADALAVSREMINAPLPPVRHDYGDTRVRYIEKLINDLMTENFDVTVRQFRKIDFTDRTLCNEALRVRDVIVFYNKYLNISATRFATARQVRLIAVFGGARLSVVEVSVKNLL